MRTIIEIPEEQLESLSYICDKQRISRAEAVRRAISLYLKDLSTVKNDSAFGIWKSKSIDSRVYQEKLREEWE
jgi:hypothetical protein